MSKTYFKPITVYATSTSADATADTTEIVVKTTALPSDDFRFIAQVLRAGVEVGGFKASYAPATGIVSIETEGSFEITDGDEITVMGVFVK